MSGMFGGGGSKYQAEQIEMQRKQLAMQEAQQKRVDEADAEMKRQAMARIRAGQGGGMRALMAEETLNPEKVKPTLGA